MTDTRKINPSVITAALAVMREAMEVTSEGHVHVFVEYSAHVAWLDVWAHPADMEYNSRDHLRLLDSHAYLDQPDSHEQLSRLLNEVSALRETAKA